MTFESFIPPRSKNVLEVTGKVAEDFQTSEENFLLVQPECKYTVAKNLEVAGKFDAIILHSELIGNLNNDELADLIKNSSAKLKSRGTLIFTLYNYGHIDNIMAILEGKPLKFKTTLSIVELEKAVADAKLNRCRSINAAKKTLIPQELATLAKTNLEIFAYVVTAIAEKLPPRTLIQSSIGENLVCGPVRIHLPNSFFITEPNIATISTPNGRPEKFFTGNEFERKIYISQRVTFPTFQVGKKTFEDLRNANYLYINEMDDHPILWEKNYKSTGFINFVGVHAIQTSTKFLADYLSQFNPHVKIFQNQLRKLLPERNFIAENNRPTTIFFGALNRDQDFYELLPILNQFAQHYGKKIAFKILARKNLFDALQAENKMLVGDVNHYDAQFVPYSVYENNLRTSDIALLPLKDTIFNRAKSDLKFIECGNCGAVALASPVVYSEVIKDGVTGFIFNNLQEFGQKLQFLIDNPTKRYEMAKNAYDYVKHNRLMSQHYEERLDWYNELFAKLPELNRETEQRIEKLVISS